MANPGEKYANFVAQIVPDGKCPRCGSTQFLVTETAMIVSHVNLADPTATVLGMPQGGDDPFVECERCHYIFGD